ncbi:DarT ssDNA thymidine ADP-ribosyltransferase family protein [Solibacillus sp. NPDC093137]|uniref:DarT ssDNA thymidine ADP-ribosyltransferase family protein n=1 Tax=Solibacillus sp. NPDC093137 TaxID=3390678 RepID=UPI003CFE65BB
MAFNRNDLSRYDNLQNSISCSVSFPNYKYFYRLRMSDTTKEWAVIAFKPSLLWEKECIICNENAARSSVSNIPVQNRIGLDVFKKIFEDIPGVYSREETGIPERYPTNPQAEVLIPDKIEPKYILGIFFEDYKTYNKYKNKLPKELLRVQTTPFRPRMDHNRW